MVVKKILIFAMILTASVSFASAQQVGCEAMAKTYFLTEMPGKIGRLSKPRKEWPEDIKRLMFKVKLNYPSEDMLVCINEGLKMARESKGIFVKDTLHGGVDDME